MLLIKNPIWFRTNLLCYFIKQHTVTVPFDRGDTTAMLKLCGIRFVKYIMFKRRNVSIKGYMSCDATFIDQLSHGRTRTTCWFHMACLHGIITLGTLVLISSLILFLDRCQGALLIPLTKFFYKNIITERGASTLHKTDEKVV